MRETGSRPTGTWRRRLNESGGCDDELRIDTAVLLLLPRHAFAPNDPIATAHSRHGMQRAPRRSAAGRPREMNILPAISGLRGAA